MKLFLNRKLKPTINKLVGKLGLGAKQFLGNFNTWQEASEKSAGYDNEQILKRAVHCKNLVINGTAEYEQDLRLYHEKPFKAESLASLLWIYINENKLRVLDLGGAFGTSYRIHQDFLKNLDVIWNIVEQKNYVEYAKNHFQTNELKFFDNINEITEINLLYLSSVLSYIENPFATLKKILAKKIPFVILDRNHFLENPNTATKLTIQKTNKMTFPTSFPCWLFNKKELMVAFSDYNVIREWRGNENEGMYYGGCLLVLKDYSLTR